MIDAKSCVSIPIADLPAFLERHALIVGRAEWPEDGEPIVYLLPGSPQPGATHPARPRGKGAKLAATLARLASQAAARPGDVERIHLPGGLRIDIMVGVDSLTRLMLARRGVHPSDQEFSTVLAHWPYDVPMDVVPEQFEFKQWRCLRAAWPTPENGSG